MRTALVGILLLIFIYHVSPRKYSSDIISQITLTLTMISDLHNNFMTSPVHTLTSVLADTYNGGVDKR